MPFSSLKYPLIGIHLLKSILTEQQISCDIYHANIDFAQLVGLVESTAPALWEIARQQVMVDIVESLFWMVFFGLAIMVCRKLMVIWRAAKEHCDPWDEPFYDIGIVASYVFIAFAVVAIFAFAAGGVKRLVNPDYYALKLLLTMATAPSSSSRIGSATEPPRG